MNLMNIFKKPVVSPESAWDWESWWGERYWGLSPYLQTGWRVIYEDGKRSQVMLKGHAFDYANMFNAPKVIKVKRVDGKEVIVREVVNPYYVLRGN